MHAYDEGIATVYGVTEAVLMNRLYCSAHMRSEKEQVLADGLYWVGTSDSILAKLFPEFSVREINRAINHLLREGIIVKASRKKAAQLGSKDWYAMTESWAEIVKKVAILV